MFRVCHCSLNFVNRRRLYQMAETAYEQEEFTDELKIRSEINRSINMERYMADSSLGVKRVSSKAEHDVIFQEQQ
jgi:replicative DNA helicase